MANEMESAGKKDVIDGAIEIVRAKGGEGGVEGGEVGEGGEGGEAGGGGGGVKVAANEKVSGGVGAVLKIRLGSVGIEKVKAQYTCMDHQ